MIRITDSGDTLWTCPLPGDSISWNRILQTADSGFAVAGANRDYWNPHGILALFTREGLAADDRLIVHPTTFILSAFPNPFNPTTTLSFTLPRTGKTTLAVYDIIGREVAVLVDGRMAAGEHILRFDGSALPSGIYFAKMRSGEIAATRKLLLLK
jgi:hypothetical protein